MARVAGAYLPDVKMPGVLPLILSAIVLLTAAVVASTMPAARAARLDVIEALRSERASRHYSLAPVFGGEGGVRGRPRREVVGMTAICTGVIPGLDRP